MSLEIVAEIAQGFEGDPKQSWLLLKSAARAKADAAKFQLARRSVCQCPGPAVCPRH